MGLIAGLFYAWACSVMPGLARTTDRTFVEAMHHMNQAIINPVFFATFLGAGPVAVAAYFLERNTGSPGAATWILVGAGLWAVMFVVTMALNVPLNDELSNSFEAGRTDFAAIREKFESPWVAWNIVRAVASAGALACLVRALMLHGKA